MMHGVHCQPLAQKLVSVGQAFVDLNFVAGSYVVNGVAQSLASVIDKPAFVNANGLDIDFFSSTNESVRIIGDAQTQFLASLHRTYVFEWIERDPPFPRATNIPLLILTDHGPPSNFYDHEIRFWTRRETFVPDPAQTRGLIAVNDVDHPGETFYYRESFASIDPDIEIAIDDVNRMAVTVEPGDVVSNIRYSVNGSATWAPNFGVKLRTLPGLSHAFIGDQTYPSSGFVRHIEIRRIRLLTPQEDAALQILSTNVGD